MKNYKVLLLLMFVFFIVFTIKVSALDPGKGDLVINEIFVGTADTSDYDGSEYVEIHNTTGNTYSLDNVYIGGTEYSGTCGGEDIWQFPSGYTIEPYGYVLVVKDVADGDGFCDVFKNAQACSDYKNIFEMYDSDQSYEKDDSNVPNMILASTNSSYDDQITYIGGGKGYGKKCDSTYNMYDAYYLMVGNNVNSLTIIDAMDWGDSSCQNSEYCSDVPGNPLKLNIANSGDTIIQRCPDGADTDDPSVDFKTGTISQATPGEANYCCDDSDTTGPNFNSTFTIINGGDKLTLELQWTAATDSENPQGIEYIIYRSTVSGFTPSDDNQIALVEGATTYIDHPLKADTNYYYIIRAINCAGLYTDSNEVSGDTKYAYNTGTEASILINEIMINPQASTGSDYDEAEYYEFYNPTNSDIDLNGYRFRDEPASYNNWWMFPPDTTIPAGGYLLVVRTACGGGSDDYSNVYPSAPTPDFEIFDPNDRYDSDCPNVPNLIKWNDQDAFSDGIELSDVYNNDCSMSHGCYGDGIQLVDGGGNIIDQIAYQPLGCLNNTTFDSEPFVWNQNPIPYNVSIGRDNNSYDYDTTPSDYDSWTCADFYAYSDGTPKAANSTSRQRVVASPIFPTAYDASTRSCPSVFLTWNCQKCADEIKIYRKTSSGVTTSDLYQTLNGYQIQYTDTNVTNGNTYYYRIAVYYDSVLSDLSDEVSVYVSPTCPPKHLLISEIFYDVDGPDDPYEFIEIYNPTTSTIDLSNYKIGDEETKMDTSYKEGMYKFPNGSSIDPGETQVIANFANGFEKMFGFLPNYEFCWSGGSDISPLDNTSVSNMSQYTVWMSSPYNYVSLGNSKEYGDQVILLDGDDHIVDAANYGEEYLGQQPFSGVNKSGQSMVRAPVWVDTDNCANDFKISDTPTPGCADGKDSTIPNAPLNLTGNDTGSNGTINLEWLAPTIGCNLVQKYNIYQSTNSDMSSATLLTTADTTNITISSIDIGTTYYYAVKSLDDANNESSYSNVIKIKCGPYGEGILTSFTYDSDYIFENTQNHNFTFTITKETNDIGEIQIEIPQVWIDANGGKLLATMFNNDLGCAQATRGNRVIFYNDDGSSVLNDVNTQINITFNNITAPIAGDYVFNIYTDVNSPTDGVNPPNFDSYSMIKYPRANVKVYSSGGIASLYDVQGSGENETYPILIDSIGNYVSINVAAGKDKVTSIKMELPPNWSGLSDGNVSIKKLPEYIDWNQYTDFYNNYLIINNDLQPGETVAIICYNLISSPNTTDNQFRVYTKTEINPEFTECNGSPINIGMTDKPWFHIYFTEALDSSFGVTNWLSNYGGAWNGTSDMDGIYSPNKHYCDTNLDDLLAYLINQGKYSLYATCYVDQTAGSSIDNAISGFSGNVKQLWHEGGTNGNTNWDIENKFGATNCKNDYDNGCDGSANGGGGKSASHNKFYVLDLNHYNDSPVGDLVWTGSWNWSSAGTSQQMQNIIYFRHPDIAQHYYNQFYLMWSLGYSADGWCKSPNYYMSIPRNKYYDPAPNDVNYYSIGGGKDNIEIYMLGYDDLSDEMRNEIYKADHTIYFAISSFTFSSIAYALEDMYDEGIYIEGVFSSDGWDYTYSKYKELKDYGINVAVDNGGGTYYCHNKYMIIDPEYPDSNPTVITGSPNWSGSADSSSTTYSDGTHHQNDENLIILHDANVANIYLQNFKYIWGNAHVDNDNSQPATSYFTQSTKPNAPQNVTASTSGLDKQIFLSWDKVTTYETGKAYGLKVKGYNIYRSTTSTPTDSDWTLLKSLHPYTTFYDTSEDLQYGVTYYYSVEAIDDRTPAVKSVKSSIVSDVPGDYVAPSIAKKWIKYDSTGNTTEIYIQWNEEMDRTVATTKSNFRLNGNPFTGKPDAVYLLSDNMTEKICYLTNRLPSDSQFYITVANQKDNVEAAGGGNIAATINVYFNLPKKSGIDLAIYSKGDYANATYNNSGDWLLYPVWSNETTPKIAYLKGNNDTADIYVISGTDTSATPIKITATGDNPTYLSQLCWSPDSNYICFAGIDASGHTQIYTEPSNGSQTGRVQINPEGTTNWGNWLDPDWYDFDPSTPNYGDSIVVSIDGNIWIFNPYSDASDKETMKLTNFSTYLQSNEGNYVKDKLLQPKWSPDGTKIVFIRDYPASNRSDIYIINNVSDILSSHLPINSWGDTNIIQVTNTNLPDWSPSWSIDGKIVAYNEDVEARFDNAFLWQKTPNQVFNNVNFDIYMQNIDGDFSNTPPQLIANNPYNEAFTLFSPSGGDKMTYVSLKSNGNNNTYTLSLLSVQTGGVLGTNEGILHDNSGSYVQVNEGSLASDVYITINTPLSAPSTDNNGNNLISTGEVREFYADGGGIDFKKPITMTITYTSAVDKSSNGINSIDDEKKLKIWYYNVDHWEKIGGIVDTKGAINNGGSITIQTNHFSTYGIFMVKAAPQNSSDVRIIPNPFKAYDNDFNTGTMKGGILFDNLSDNIKTINIYNIVGELVVSYKYKDGDNNIKYRKTTENQTDLIDTEYSGIVYKGGLAKWNLKNSNNQEVASGLYIIVVEDMDGTKSIKKFAIIK